jgi:hypothetical protein
MILYYLWVISTSLFFRVLFIYIYSSYLLKLSLFQPINYGAKCVSTLLKPFNFNPSPFLVWIVIFVFKEMWNQSMFVIQGKYNVQSCLFMEINCRIFFEFYHIPRDHSCFSFVICSFRSAKSPYIIGECFVFQFSKKIGIIHGMNKTIKKRTKAKNMRKYMRSSMVHTKTFWVKQSFLVFFHMSYFHWLCGLSSMASYTSNIFHIFLILTKFQNFSIVEFEDTKSTWYTILIHQDQPIYPLVRTPSPCPTTKR